MKRLTSAKVFTIDSEGRIRRKLLIVILPKGRDPYQVNSRHKNFRNH